MKNPTNCNTILVVEDDEQIRESVQDILELEGYLVQLASNGVEALTLLNKREKPCLVLLDLMMPIMGGRECLDKMKIDPSLSEIPVFIMSAIADRNNTRGAVGFIKKPADMDSIINMVKSFCHH